MRQLARTTLLYLKSCATRYQTLSYPKTRGGRWSLETTLLRAKRGALRKNSLIRKSRVLSKTISLLILSLTTKPTSFPTASVMRSFICLRGKVKEVDHIGKSRTRFTRSLQGQLLLGLKRSTPYKQLTSTTKALLVAISILRTKCPFTSSHQLPDICLKTRA